MSPIAARAETLIRSDATFFFSEVPPGRYSFYLPLPDDFPYFIQGPAEIEVKSGETTASVSIALRPTVAVRGTVVDDASGKGMPNVKVNLWRSQAGAGGIGQVITRGKTARTDSAGAYAARMPPGTLMAGLGASPDPDKCVQVAAETGKDAAMPPIRMKPTWSAEGVVVDESGKPVADAEVHSLGSGTRLSQPDGKFTLPDLRLDQTVTLAARTPWAAVAAPVTVRHGDGPVRLVVSEKNAFRLRGSVVDETGRPVAGASLWIGSGGGVGAESDAQGRYEFGGLWAGDWPGEVDSAEAEGFMGREGGPRFLPGTLDPLLTIHGEPGKVAELPKVVMLGLRGTVEGTVVDSAGKPLADVLVYSCDSSPGPIDTRTNAAGRFRLERLVSGDVFVFAAKAEYRFTGRIVASGTRDVVVRLSRRDEAVPPQPAPSSLAEEQSLARRCLLKLWDLAADDATKAETIKRMARVDLDQARRWSLESEGLGRAEVERAFIEKTAERDLDKAIALVEAADEDVNRFDALAALVRRLAATDPAKAMRCVEKMASLALASGDVSERVMQLARAGRLAMRLGKSNAETGRKWVEEAARSIDASTYTAQREVAWAVASYDLVRAFRLLKRLNNPKMVSDYLPRLAIAGCSIDVDQSLLILKDLESQPGESDSNPHPYRQAAQDARVRIACRLAAAQPDRAVKLVEEMSGETEAWLAAYGSLAVAMARTIGPGPGRSFDRALPTGLEKFSGFLPGTFPFCPEISPLLAAEARRIGYPDVQSAVWRVVADVVFDVADYLPAQDNWESAGPGRPRDGPAGLPGHRAPRPTDRVNLSCRDGSSHFAEPMGPGRPEAAEELFDRQLADIGTIEDADKRNRRLSEFRSEAEAMAELLATPPAERFAFLASRLGRAVLEEDD